LPRREPLVSSPIDGLVRDGRTVTLRMPVMMAPPRAQVGSITLRMPVVSPPAPKARAHEESVEPAMDEMDPLESWGAPPAGGARRARLAAFFAGAIAAVVLLIGAGTRLTHARAGESVAIRPTMSSRSADTSTAPSSPPTLPPGPVTATSQEPPVAAPPPPMATPPIPREPAPRETAEGEKRKARAALEGGAPGRAIAAGERSVALDPTDAEAWLILGGAYQMRGLGSDAHRAFASCVRHGRTGPVAECRSLLQ
jgi:hypothetical protein